MKHYEITKITENKGQPRIWIQGRRAAIAGFLPGCKYDVDPDPERCLLTLKLSADGRRVVARKGSDDQPVIDLNSTKTLGLFAGLKSIRIVVKKGVIHLLPVASELRAKRRLERLRERVGAGEAVTIGSVSSGVGILDMAAHEGLASAGVDAELAFANEIRSDCMEHAAAKNPAYTASTITLTAPMQEVVFDPYAMSRLPETDILIGGIPCSGASLAGRSKLKLKHPEDHEEVGHLAVAFLAMIAKTNPAVAVLENVVQYGTTASMSIIRNQLRDLGYTVYTFELDAAEWNMLEHRKRLVVVAVTNGISFSIDDLEKPEPALRTFGEIMDNVPLDASTWGNIDYLWKKLDRDKADGKGYAPTVVDKDSTRLPTLNKTLHKRQSTGTFIQHPADPTLYRIPTVAEHARAKGVMECLVAGTTQTFGHEALGQAISVPPFVSVFKLIGRALLAFARTADEAVAAMRNLVPTAVAVG